MPRPNSRRRLNSEDSPSIASYGMGSTYASASYAGEGTLDHVSVEVSDVYEDPLSNKPKPKVKRSMSANRVSFRKDTKVVKPRGSMKKRHNPALPEPTREDPGSGKYWKCYTLAATCLIPDFLICRPDKAAKQAWREKIAIFEIFLSANIIFLFLFGAIPLYFCRVTDNPLAKYDWYESSIDEVCNVMMYASYVIIFAVAALLALQCACSLVIGCQSLAFRLATDRPWEPQDFKSNVMVMVPCYNEGEKELRKTINSILDSNYPPDHKVLMVVADGIITGRGEYFNTPATLARLLGFTLDSKRDQAYAYKSLGGSGENRASVYSGLHERDGKRLKYVVIVKRGTPAEKESSKPGNRGKRDSQLIALGLFNRVQHDRKRSDLDKALVEAFDSLGVPVKNINYMLAIDADTRISIPSICHMVYKMNTQTGVLACCGETKVDNKTASWVSMIQVYE
jgi:Chitin synthase